MNFARVARQTLLLLVIVCASLLVVNFVLLDTIRTFRVPLNSSTRVRSLSPQALNCLPSSVVKLLQSSALSNLELFIIEPLVLKDLLQPLEMSKLRENGLFPKDVSNCSSSSPVSIGVLAEALNKLEVINLCDKLEPFKGFTCVELRTVWSDLPSSEPRKRSNRDMSKGPGSHYFLHHEDQAVHIVVFYRFKEALMVTALPSNYVRNGSRFGSNGAQVYDSFSLHEPFEVSILNLAIRAPSEPGHFLSQLDTARFVSCDSQLAATRRENSEKSWSAYFLGLVELFKWILRTQREQRASKGLAAMRRMSKELSIPIWLASGTLLGWYRECAFISHTKDMDFATWSKFANARDKKDILAHVQKSPDLSLLIIYGLFHEGYEMTFEVSSMHLDLFFTYEQENSLTYSGHIVSERAHFKYFFPKFELCSSLLFGQKVLVPCNPVEVIKAEYGPHWATPVADWSYIQSAHNLGPITKWPENVTDFYWRP